MPMEDNNPVNSAVRESTHHRLLYHYIFYLAILTVAVLVTTVINSRVLRESTYTVTRSDLHSVATVVRNLLPPEALSEIDIAQRFCETAAADTGTRITIIRPDGTVLADSAADPSGMENHADRPEIRAALGGGEGVSIRYSATLDRELMYAALPVLRDGAVAGVVRTSLEVTDVESLLQDLYVRIALTTTALLFFSLLVTVLISRSLRRPLRDLHDAAGAYSRGEFDHTIPVAGPREIQNLGVALNSMARELRQRMEEIDRRRRETEEVLNTIREPLILLDDELKLRRANLAATRLATTEHGQLIDRPLLEVFRNAELDGFARELLQGDGGEEREIIFYGEPEMRLRVWGTRLPAPGSVLRGSLLILMRDVTQEHRIDRIRRDFVANVSHELKTPLTMITGAVETLDEMGGDEAGRRRFQRMIGENARRMASIIEDLLSLARIEQTDLATLPKRSTPLMEILEEARRTVAPETGAEAPTIQMVGDRSLTAPIHPALMVQALANLLDNAIKYSDPGVRITLTASRTAAGPTITVADTGWGIPVRDQDRIFERFYRVDRSRSRESGGTGLGLSIVRHVVRLHGGTVTLESSPGKGSSFTIFLPGAIS